MKKQRVVRGIPVEVGSGNVYADLGYPDSGSMLVKAQLAAKIAEIVQRRALTQTRTAEILGLTQPKVSAILKGRFRGISEHRLLECLTRLGRDVHIVIEPTPRNLPEWQADAFRSIASPKSTSSRICALPICGRVRQQIRSTRTNRPVTPLSDSCYHFS
jgi:predicted XRE-type DNA-binding protein